MCNAACIYEAMNNVHIEMFIFSASITIWVTPSLRLDALNTFDLYHPDEKKPNLTAVVSRMQIELYPCSGCSGSFLTLSPCDLS